MGGGLAVPSDPHSVTVGLLSPQTHPLSGLFLAIDCEMFVELGVWVSDVSRQS